MPLTPEEFNKLALKEDITKLENRFDKLENRFDNVMDALDGITKKLENMSQEATSNIAAHERTENDIKTHDIRIKKLELA